MFCEHEFVKQGIITSICRFCGFVTNGAETIKQLQSELAAAREEITALQKRVRGFAADVAKLRALCAGAAEQFNRCYDPAMVGRLAAAGRGEGER